MKALTVRQPWAWCIAAGAKTIENRTQSFGYRGPLAIHAAAGWAKHGATDSRVIQEIDRWRYPHEHGHEVENGGSVPFHFRKVVAVVDLVDCHKSNGCCAPWGDQTACHHLVLANIRRLDIPTHDLKGRLGLWDVDDDLIDEALAANAELEAETLVARDRAREAGAVSDAPRFAANDDPMACPRCMGFKHTGDCDWNPPRPGSAREAGETK